jgi:hypothetical protein
MPLRLVESICHPDEVTNADGWFADAATAVLLDGATPKATFTVSPRANDTVWLVQRFLELWPTLSARARGMAERAELARLVLRDELDGLCAKAGATPDEGPFACLAIAHDAGAHVELLNMGDLTLLLRGSDGSVRRLGESAVRELDRRAIAGIERALAAGVVPHAERLRSIASQLFENRSLRNVLSGYEVLEPGVSCLHRFQRWIFARSEVRELLLMSDGFYRLVDTFDAYDDASLFDAVERRGLASLLGELRAIERQDAECVRRPRFKTHDDATALWLELT